jgi:hypothetical protein
MVFMRSPRALVTLLLGAAVGCSLTTDLSRLAGGAADGGAEPSDAESLPDGAGEANSAGNTDGAADGTRDADAFCTSLLPSPTFCDDFDENPIGFDWAAPNLVSGAARVFDSTTFTSSPHSLYFTLPQLDGGQVQSIANQRKDFMGTLSGIMVAFAVRVDAMASGTAAGLAAIHGVDTQGGLLELRFIQTSSGGADLSEARNPGTGFTYRSYGLNRYPLSGQWTRVSFDLGFGPGNVATASATIDGVEALAPTPLQASMAPQPLSVVLGFGYVSPSLGGWKAHYDDVTVRTR